MLSVKIMTTVSLVCALTEGLPINNGIIGDLNIDCRSDSILLGANTTAPFFGNIYVKNVFANSSCRTKGTGNEFPVLLLKLNDCNLHRRRSLNPRGVTLSVTIVVSFHPSFVTKIDRAFNIQCFYMEAEKTVSTAVEASMLTTLLATQTMPMPVCTYQILERPGGPVVSVATVGQAVYHQWSCDHEAPETFCMYVHSCYVEDGRGHRLDLLDPQGCAEDVYLLGDPEYVANLVAGVQVHVFKYYDHSYLYFQCQISIDIKEPSEECEVPVCSALGRRSGNGLIRRSARQTLTSFQKSDLLVDVSVNMESVDVNVDSLDVGGRQILMSFSGSERQHCYSILAFSAILYATASLVIVNVLVAFLLLKKFRPNYLKICS